MKKKLIALVLCALIAATFVCPALAADAYSDVDDGAWYAQGVYALGERGIMNGMGGGMFAPDGAFTRAQLAAVMYRMAGSPEVTGEDAFTDTEAGAWYETPVLWASQSGIVNGMGGGIFAPNEAVTQEQLAVMLWRDAGSYVLGDEYKTEGGAWADASEWAKMGVLWCEVEKLTNENGAPFEPKAPATRAQVADTVYRCILLKESFANTDAVSAATKTADTTGGEDESQTAETQKKVLVACFSCTENTARIAELAADAMGADLYRITPETPYTSEDLNYNDDTTRATREQHDDSARPAISGSVENMADYDVIFIGYPIWWGQAPKIMYSFVESYDLSGKTIVPFCTSGSSSIGTSADNLKKSAADANWTDGRRFSGGDSRDSVVSWINSLSIGVEAK